MKIFKFKTNIISSVPLVSPSVFKSFVGSPKLSISIFIPGLLCRSCWLNGETAWVIFGRTCPKCGTRNSVASFIIKGFISICIFLGSLGGTVIFYGYNLENLTDLIPNTFTVVDSARSLFNLLTATVLAGLDNVHWLLNNLTTKVFTVDNAHSLLNYLTANAFAALDNAGRLFNYLITKVFTIDNAHSLLNYLTTNPFTSDNDYSPLNYLKNLTTITFTIDNVRLLLLSLIDYISIFDKITLDSIIIISLSITYFFVLKWKLNTKKYYVIHKDIIHECKHPFHCDLDAGKIYHDCTCSKKKSNKISEMYKFITSFKKSMPVPGVQCPNCLEKGQTVWVIPGKNCPRCGTPCSRVKHDISIGMITLITVGVTTTLFAFILAQLRHVMPLNITGADPESNGYFTIGSYNEPEETHTSYTNSMDYTNSSGSSNEPEYTHTNSTNSTDSTNSTNYTNSTDCTNENINTVKSEKQSETNKTKDEPVVAYICSYCENKGHIVYLLPGEKCSEEGHVHEDQPGYETDESDEDVLCWDCLEEKNEIQYYQNDGCPSCGGRKSERLQNQQTNYKPSNTDNPLFQFIIIKQVTLILLYTIILSMTNMGVYVISSGFFILIILALCNNNGKLISNKTNNNQESLYMTIYNIVINQIDEFRGQWYFPILYAIFVFIVINNIIGMIPYSFSTTAHFILTFFLSIVVVFGSTILGIFIHILKFFGIVVPENCPLPLLALLTFIETISYIARNISLGLRLAANVLSGHMLLNILSGFTYKISKKGFFYALADLIPSSFVTAFSALEVGIAFIQAQVFSVLSGSYVKDGINLH